MWISDVPPLFSVKIQFIAGDSGGPLMLRDPELHQYELLGVTSFGIGCDHELYPGVYTR